MYDGLIDNDVQKTLSTGAQLHSLQTPSPLANPWYRRVQLQQEMEGTVKTFTPFDVTAYYSLHSLYHFPSAISASLCVRPFQTLRLISQSSTTVSNTSLHVHSCCCIHL